MDERRRQEDRLLQPQAGAPDRQMHTSPFNSGDRPVGRSAAETIFDFALPEPSEQEIASLYQRTEYLLDAMEIGGVDRSATDDAFAEGRADPGGEREPQADARGHLETPPPVNGNGASHRRSSIVPLVRDDERHAKVLPEEALPSIRGSILSPRPSTTQERSPETLPQHAPGRLQTERVGAQTVDPPLLGSTPLTAGTRPKSGTRPAPVPVAEQRGASLTATEMDRLEREIAALYDHVNRLQENRREITGHALSLLDEARTIVQTQPARLGRADYNLRQVRGILERARESRRRSVRYAVQLLVYLSLWLAICAGGTVALLRYQQDLVVALSGSVGAGSPLTRHALALSWALLMGGTGGVLGAIGSLIGHLRAGQEFDRQYVLRYVIQPVMGVVLGLLLYVVILAVADAFEVDLLASPIMRWIPAAVALPAGLWQEWVYGLLYRMTRFFTFGSRRR